MATIIRGPDVVLACPSCSAEARLPTYDIGESAEAVSWTDGYREIVGLRREPDIGRCLACGKLYWVEKARRLGEISAGREVPVERAGWQHAPIVELLDEHDYYEAFETGLAAEEEQKLALRVFAWWRTNDRFRRPEDGGGRFATEERAVHNLERLVELCAGGNHEILLFRVEALRELGRFGEAAEALAGLCSDYDAARERFERLIEERSRDLAILFD